MVEGAERIAHADVVDGEGIRIENGKDRRGCRERCRVRALGAFQSRIRYRATGSRAPVSAKLCANAGNISVSGL